MRTCAVFPTLSVNEGRTGEIHWDVDSCWGYGLSVSVDCKIVEFGICLEKEKVTGREVILYVIIITLLDMVEAFNPRIVVVRRRRYVTSTEVPRVVHPNKLAEKKMGPKGFGYLMRKYTSI